MGSVTSPTLDRDEYSFKEMWEQAQLRFQERTAKILKSAPGQTLEDVLKDLEKKYPEDSIFEKPNGSQSNVKDVVRNILNCISILGGIVAQGASMAFGGAADICYSAVSFLIEMHARIDRLYEGLAQLFEEISTFLKTFKIYKRIEKFAEVDPELKAITSRLMISFVDICALSIKLLNGSKWKKFKTVLKVALMDDDSGIRAELEKFKGLIDQSSRISDAVTLERVMVSHHEVVQLLNDASRASGQQLLYLEDIGNGVNVLKADMNEHKTQQIHSTQIQELMKKLSINQETAKFSAKYLEDLRTSPIPNTGLWLKEIVDYQSWANGVADDTKSLLILQGGEKSGKSFLIGSIIDELEFQFREGRKSENRISVAYYCFSKLDKKLESSKFIKHPHLPVTALKSMAIRFAEQSVSYSKEMATFWATKKATDHGTMSCRELWDALQLSSPKGSGMHYLIFDGLEVLTESDALELFGVLLNVQSSRVRLLAASNRAFLDTSLESIQERLSEANIPRIDVELGNGPDIRIFVDHYLSQNGELFGQDVETSKLKDWLRDQLPNVVNGNFFRLQTALDRCAEDYKRSQSVSDIIRNLETVDLSQDSNAAAMQVIARLNNSLNNQEIEQLNEILTWVIYGRRYFTVDELRTALFLRFKSEPAQPLSVQLANKGKYESLFFIDEDHRIYPRDNIASFLVASSRSKRLGDGVGKGDKPKISMTIKITNADIETVQRFFWDLGERAVFEKFAFDNLESRLETQKRIYFHAVESAISTILRCTDILLGEPNETSAPMVAYALNHLPEHLEKLKEYVDAGEVKDLEMQNIVDKIVNLLSDTECIEKYWTRSYNLFSFGLPVFTWCLYQTGAMESLRPRDRRWLEKLDTSKNPKVSCLHDIALMVARHWLRRRDWQDCDDLARWIFDYIGMLATAGTAPTVNEKEGETPAFVYPTGTVLMDQIITPMDLDAIYRAVNWVEEELKITAKDALWFERLGDTFLAIEFLDEAQAAFLDSKSLPDAHWKAPISLGGIHSVKGEFEMALKETEAVMEDLRARHKSAGVPGTSPVDLLRVLRLRAWCHFKSTPSNVESAVALYQEILEIDPDDYYSQWRLFRILIDANRLSDALQPLRAFTAQPANKIGELDQLAKMLFHFFSDVSVDFLWSIETFDLLVLVTTNDPLSALILERLKKCIDMATKENNTSALEVLLLLQGIALFQQNLDSADQKDAIASWKKCCSLGFKREADYGGDRRSLFTITQATKRITYYHYESARKGGIDAQQNIAELQEFYGGAQKIYWTARPVVCALAAYYASSDSPEKTRDLLLDDMKTALDLLSDDDPDNDFQGYLWMAEVMVHAGDDLNALSAWSLLVPDDVDEHESNDSDNVTEASDDKRSAGDSNSSDEDQDEARETDSDNENEQVENDEESANEAAADASSQKSLESTISSPPKTIDAPPANGVVPKIAVPETNSVDSSPKARTGKLNNYCDGGCGTEWAYTDDLYVCKICSDTQFDLGCLTKLRAGTLKKVVCSRQHEWLHLPPFSDEEYQKVGKGNVRTGGTLVDGARQGGDIVPIAVWLDAIRAQWGIPKPVKSNMPTVKNYLFVPGRSDSQTPPGAIEV